MSNSEYIRQTVLAWPGVSEHPHRFGGTEFRLGKRELGHIHGERLVDIPFTKPVHDEVIAAGLAQKHHFLPESGWVSVWLRGQEDVERAVLLLQRSFELATAQKQGRQQRAEGLK
jgi:hypothetical protein